MSSRRSKARTPEMPRSMRLLPELSGADLMDAPASEGGAGPKGQRRLRLEGAGQYLLGVGFRSGFF